MRMLLAAEYAAMAAPPEIALPEEPFLTLIARGLLVVVYQDQLGSHTQFTVLGLLAMRVYEAIHSTQGAMTS